MTETVKDYAKISYNIKTVCVFDEKSVKKDTWRCLLVSVSPTV